MVGWFFHGELRCFDIGGGGGGKGKVGVKTPYLSINSKLTLHEIKVLEINAT